MIFRVHGVGRIGAQLIRLHHTALRLI